MPTLDQMDAAFFFLETLFSPFLVPGVVVSEWLSLWQGFKIMLRRVRNWKSALGLFSFLSSFLLTKRSLFSVQIALLLLLLSAVLGEREHMCRTRSVTEIQGASAGRIVWTPRVRRGSATSSTFFPAAEYAGILNTQVGFPNMIPCVMTPAEDGQTTFKADRSATTKNIMPGSLECKDATGVRVESLRDVRGEVIIVAHGDPMEARLTLGYGKLGDQSRESFSPDELANLLIESGLPCDATQVTLLIVRGGLRVSDTGAARRYAELYRKMTVAKNAGDQNGFELYQNEWAMLGMRQRSARVYEANADIGRAEIPAVVELTMALRDRGLIHVQVKGVRAEVKMRLNRSGGSGGAYRGLEVYVTTKDLATGQCAKSKNAETCVDDLLAPCDQCLLANAKSGRSWTTRLSECHTKLSTSHPDAAKICGVTHRPISDKWFFSVDSKRLPNQQ